MIKFYKGDAEKYNPEEYGEGIYFTNDTNEILHNGMSYSGKKDYTSSLEDKTLETAYDIGGIKKGTKVEDLEGKTYNDLFDEILFPTVYPTFVNPSTTISLTNYNAVQEIGYKAPDQTNFITTYDPGSINLNGVKQNNRGGDLNNESIYVNEESNTTFPETVALGNTNYYYKVSYEEGPQPKDNKGNDYDSPLESGSVVSKPITINGTLPWYATTVKSGELTSQNLISWNDTSGSMQAGKTGIGFELQPHSKNAPQQIKVPRQITKLYQLNTNSSDNSAGMGAGFIDVGISAWTLTTSVELINGNQRRYFIYTFNGDDRGSVKLIIKF